MNHTEPEVCPYCKPIEPDDPRHGTPNGYVNLRCRCDACKAAGAVYFAARRAAKSVAGGAR